MNRCPKCGSDFVCNSCENSPDGYVPYRYECDTVIINGEVYKEGDICLRRQVAIIEEKSNQKDEIIKSLSLSLHNMLSWADNPAVPPDKYHHCGPEGNCDMDCVNWSYYCADMFEAKRALKLVEKETNNGKM